MGINKTSIAEMIDKIKNQIEHKPILIIAVPLLCLLLLAVPIMLVLTSGDSEIEDKPAVSDDSVPAMGNAEQTPTIEILPEPERALPEKDPFGSSGIFAGSGSFILTGTLSGSNGVSAAIISVGGSSYVVRQGDTVGDTKWSVTDIRKDAVTISDGETEKILELVPDARTK